MIGSGRFATETAVPLLLVMMMLTADTGLYGEPGAKLLAPALRADATATAPVKPRAANIDTGKLTLTPVPGTSTVTFATDESDGTCSRSAMLVTPPV
eukprot:7006296-Pyramimonas_sp.AAC.1